KDAASSRHSRSAMALRFFSARYSRRRVFFDLLALAGTAILGGGGEMLGDAFREIMRTGPVWPQHEVKIIRLGRMQSRGQRILAGVPDGAGRQAHMTVSVVWAHAGQIGLMNDARVVSRQQGAIDRGRVAVELHSDLHAVMQH